MNIYLIRHGEAEHSSNHKSSDERELTEEGIKNLKLSIQIWKNFLPTIDIILTSPLKRARQTASIIKEQMNVQPEIIELISLANGALTEELISIAESMDVQEIAMVGHQPDVSNHIAQMIGVNEFNGRIQPGAIAKISFAVPGIRKGKLEFLIPPVNNKG